MYCNNYSIESVLPTPIPLGNAFLLVVSLVFFGAIFVVIASNVLFFSKSQMSKVSNVFLHHGFEVKCKRTYHSSYTLGKVGKDNYRLLDVSQFK